MSEREDTQEQTLRGRRPSLVRAALTSAALTSIAGATWAVAWLAESGARTPLDPVAIFARTMALVLSLLAARALRDLALRAHLRLGAKEARITMDGDEVHIVLGGEEQAIARADIAAIVAEGDWRAAASSREARVFLLLRSGRHVTIPPLFGRGGAALAEQLMRWRGPPPVAPPRVNAEGGAALDSVTYRQAADGEAPPGGHIVASGRGWLARGPYATVLLGVALLDGWARAHDVMLAAAGPWFLGACVACLVVVPGTWLLMTWRAIAPRLGLALVLTQDAALVRTRSGVTRLPWADMARIHTTVRTTWSVLHGYRASRALVLELQSELSVHFDEAFLALPVEVAAALCEHQRRLAGPPRPRDRAHDPGTERHYQAIS